MSQLLWFRQFFPATFQLWQPFRRGRRFDTRFHSRFVRAHCFPFNSQNPMGICLRHFIEITRTSLRFTNSEHLATDYECSLSAICTCWMQSVMRTKNFVGNIFPWGMSHKRVSVVLFWCVHFEFLRWKLAEIIFGDAKQTLIEHS